MAVVAVVMVVVATAAAVHLLLLLLLVVVVVGVRCTVLHASRLIMAHRLHYVLLYAVFKITCDGLPIGVPADIHAPRPRVLRCDLRANPAPRPTPAATVDGDRGAHAPEHR